MNECHDNVVVMMIVVVVVRKCVLESRRSRLRLKLYTSSRQTRARARACVRARVYQRGKKRNISAGKREGVGTNNTSKANRSHV